MNDQKKKQISQNAPKRYNPKFSNIFLINSTSEQKVYLKKDIL